MYPERAVGVVAGGAGSLTCVAYGQPRPNMTWFRDGIPIDNSTHFTIYETFLEDTNVSFVQSILEVCLFLPELEGNYSCHTENELGSNFFTFSINVTYG